MPPLIALSGCFHAIITHMSTLSLPDSCCQGERPTVWIWPGYAAYWGPSLQLGTHSGSVHCFALGLDAPFQLHSAGTPARLARSALIPARRPHRLTAGDGRMVFFYVDPSSAGSGHLRDRMLDQAAAIAYDHRDESEMIADWASEPPPDPAALRQRVLGPEEASPMDERIRQALQIMGSRPGEQLSADALAAEVGLSASRFLHLFSAHAGTSFRRYRLWLRMRHAASALSQGADLTLAATEAGFASPSHFSDAFRAMFGLTATELLAGRTRILVQSP